ncbi:small acid-soluble spore protein Tlp [Halalkalibacterium ligniniphilum]|uniref:small acid-soluble spore protein Tlp n=1 Tax=Halalkalibacterium ligniniphilum TaxID=1134413 RepID=UPI00034D8B6E|nr:small acid-soluble spore protein Tlp [Halalkalibacterium ligniniphilum]
MAKPDDRSNNVERLAKMRENTKENIEAAEETLGNDSLKRSEKQAIKEKNERRKQSIASFEAEMADEMAARKKNVKGE